MDYAYIDVMDITFSIIGTAGRNDDGNRLSRQHFDAMCIVANGLLEQFAEINYPITHLVSGGAAWADHVAVKLFLDKKVPNLRLFLPAKWDYGAFRDNGKPNDPKENPGGIANHYHRKFQTISGINSLSQLQIAKNEGAEFIEVEKGFYARNALVAKSDFLLAMTFGIGPMVKEGGTSNTVETYLNRVRKEGFFDKSFHYNLFDGKIYVGCQLPPKENVKQKKLPMAVSNTFTNNKRSIP